MIGQDLNILVASVSLMSHRWKPGYDGRGMESEVLDTAKITFSILGSLVFVLPVFGQQAANTDVAANPGRPTVSTPATLTPPGYLQFETGVLGARHSFEFSSLLNLNEVLKLTVVPRFELIFSSVPVAHYRAGVRTSDRTGDYLVGAQGVLFRGNGARPTLAASYFRKVYDGGAAEVDIGSPRQSFLILASADVKGFHYDTNFLANEIAQNGVRLAEFGQTLSISHPVGKRFSISGELWHFTQPFLRRHAAGNLWAVGYTARSNLVLDAGFDRGLTGTSTRWQTFVGITYLFPHRLWGQR